NMALPLLIDGTASNAALMNRRMQILKAIGYDIAMIYVKSDVETAMQRNKQRDRTVSQQQVERSHKALEDAMEFYSNRYDVTLFAVDNTQQNQEHVEQELNEIAPKLNEFFT
ncbi:MAG: hypothetical protein CUN55_20890, partial [Phototrophicales bacterium]